MSGPLLLGRAKKRVDPRTIRYGAVRSVGTWKAPTTWAFDKEHPGLLVPMFGNDQYGDCVIAARAHQTLRFEVVEKGIAPKIADVEVVGEYLAETGGKDTGLNMLDSMKAWAKRGWVAGGTRYYAHSFYGVVPQLHGELMEACLVGGGVQIGVRLPLSASDQISAGKPWDVVAGDRGAPDSWGGHDVLIVAYDPDGIEVVTWGQRQRATWRWLDEYADECFLIVDAIDRMDLVANRGVVVAALDAARVP